MLALDYCRPVGPLFELPLRAGTIHSCFRRAANIAIGDTILTLLSFLPGLRALDGFSGHPYQEVAYGYTGAAQA